MRRDFLHQHRRHQCPDAQLQSPIPRLRVTATGSLHIDSRSNSRPVIASTSPQPQRPAAERRLRQFPGLCEQPARSCNPTVLDLLNHANRVLAESPIRRQYDPMPGVPVNMDISMNVLPPAQPRQCFPEKRPDWRRLVNAAAASAEQGFPPVNPASGKSWSASGNT